ncbi:MAG: HAD family hydrolase, partial [Acidobacteria bacterium]|nr:HAD family hydrolase [Acidobacteriota bacterium]
ESHFLEKTAPFEGLNPLVKEISKSLKLAITTMKKGIYAREIVSHFGWENLFQCVVGAEEGGGAKPNPEMLEKAISEMSHAKDEIVYIGDTLVDYETAKNANVNFVFVKWGYGEIDGKEDNLEVVSNPYQLLSLLKESF